MRKPFFVVLEGIDGSGKTTLMHELWKFFLKKDINTVITKEPSDLFSNIIFQNFDDSKKVNTYLFAADRLLHMKQIDSQLRSGKSVICDRWFISSLVYQSEGMEKSALMKEFNFILRTNEFLLDFPLPDLVVYLNISVDEAMDRMVKSMKTFSPFEKRDILERCSKVYPMALEFYSNVFQKQFYHLHLNVTACEQIWTVLQS